MAVATDTRSVVELIAATTVTIGVVGVLWQSFKRGIGARTIQFAGAVMLIPVVLILALEKILEPAALGVVFGAVIGYVLSSVGEAAISRAEQGGTQR